MTVTNANVIYFKRKIKIWLRRFYGIFFLPTNIFQLTLQRYFVFIKVSFHLIAKKKKNCKKSNVMCLKTRTMTDNDEKNEN